jgi:hypothetical protein
MMAESVSTHCVVPHAKSYIALLRSQQHRYSKLSQNLKDTPATADPR